MTSRNRDHGAGAARDTPDCTDAFQPAPIPSTGSLSVTDREIHVWRVGLEVSSSVEQHLTQILSPEERSRLERFKSSKHRRRFAVRRGALRILLSAYTGIAGADLRFSQGKYGKPGVESEPGRPIPCFNTSSSCDFALIAVSRRLSLGVDLEYMRHIDRIHDIAERFFSRSERDSLSELPGEIQLAGFYRIWTSKEAVIKADGSGLSMPLDSFVVNGDPRSPAQLLSTTGKINAPKDLVLYGLEPGEGYSGALATSQPGLSICCFSLDIGRPTGSQII